MCRTSVQLLASSYCPSQPCLARAVFALSSQPNRRVAPANYHMATALANGTVLLAGGYDGANFLTSAQSCTFLLLGVGQTPAVLLARVAITR